MKPKTLRGYGVLGQRLTIDLDRVYMWKEYEFNGVIGTDVFLSGQSSDERPIRIEMNDLDFTELMKSEYPPE